MFVVALLSTLIFEDSSAATLPLGPSGMDWLEPPQPRHDSEWIGIFTLKCDYSGRSEEVSDMMKFTRHEFDVEQPFVYFSWSLEETPENVEALRDWMMRSGNCGTDLEYDKRDADLVAFNGLQQEVSLRVNGTLMTLERGRCLNDTIVNNGGPTPSEEYDIGHWSDDSVASQVALVPRDE